MDHDPGLPLLPTIDRRPRGPGLSRRALLRLIAGTPAAMLLATPGCCRLLEPEGEGDPDIGGEDVAADAPADSEPRWRRPPPTDEPLVRIRVGSSPAASPIRIGAAGEPVLVDRPTADPRVPPGSETTLLRGPVEIRRAEPAGGAAAGSADRSGGGTATVWTFRDGAGRRGQWVEPAGAAGEPPSPLELGRPRPDLGDAVVGGSPASELLGPLTWNGIAWPGRLRLVAGETRTHVLAVVPMEAYIPGVLAREIFPGWRDATFAAQAIAARSFATFEVLARSRRPWDVEADQRSQMFAGRTTLAQALAAGASTAGQVLTYGGGVLPAYYSSTCGGIGMPARLAIGPAPVNGLPPMAGHALDCCRDAPRFRWIATRTLGRLRTQLRAWGAEARMTELAEIGPVRELAVATRTAHGRPASYELIHGDEGDGGAGGRRLRLDGPVLRRALQSGRRDDEAPVWSGFLEPVVDRRAGRLTLAGRGWGHGAGMCQYGAQGLAQRGWTATAILEAYFPGALITRAWSARPAATA